MAKKRPPPVQQLPSPSPSSSSSEEEEEEEEEEAAPRVLPPADKKFVYVRSPIITRRIRSPSQSDSALGSESGTDSANPQFSPTALDFALNPVVSKSNREPRSKRSKISNSYQEKKSAIHRLWSEDDEIAILEGMSNYQFENGADPSSDLDGFHEFIKRSLRVDVSRNQLMSKIKRLKKKYRDNLREKGNLCPNPHEKKSFELSKKVWGGNNNNSNIESSNVKTIEITDAIKCYEVSEKEKAIERLLQQMLRTLRSEIRVQQEDFLSMHPTLRESLEVEKGCFLSMSKSVKEFVKEKVSLIGSTKAKDLDQKWRNLRIGEIEWQLKRFELIVEQTKLLVSALKSS